MALNHWLLRRRLRQLGEHFHSTGLLFGTCFFALSLTPSLLPRDSVGQGILSGLSMAAGYGIGVLLYTIWRYFHLPLPRQRVLWVLQLITGVLALCLAVGFLWRASHWQGNLHRLMGMEEVTGLQVTTIAATALLVFMMALTIARLFRRTWHYLVSHLHDYIPARLAVITGLLVAFALFWGLVDGVLYRFALQAADRSYQGIDALMEAEDAPSDPLKAGGPGSLLNWEELGRQGRRYVRNGPSAEDIAAFSPRPTQTPLRVYVGLNSAETPEERAALALAELQRIGAFERSLLVLVTPTGTGWVDPGSIDTIEYLHHGDVASVAAQYSYLPSPISLISEGAYGVEMARALFQEVYGYWRNLPSDQRPRLYLLGLSLGALNSDLSFDFYDIIDDPFQGALWSGPPYRTPTWRDVTARRDNGSPAWRPVFRDGSVVRFGNQEGGWDLGGRPWGDFRIAFLQYASDPITFFESGAYFREPQWMSGERAFDVSSQLRWFPVITWLQLAADMATGSSPLGYGHDYAPAHYHDAWLALTEPEGWTEEALARLRAMHQQAQP